MDTLDLPPRLFVVDLEATCDDQGSIPRPECEIIEIGGVVVDTETLEPIDEFSSFVKPLRHPKLTKFCTELTSITQEDVENAPPFPVVIDRLGRFVANHRPFLFCSWGDYDKNQLGRDARHHRVTIPLGDAHLNLKKKFAETIGDPKRYGMAEALQKVGLPLEGTYHRGIDDARNMVRMLPWILGRRSLR